MRLRLKKELCFVYNNEGIEVYYGNAQLNKLITTENNFSFFKFLEFLSKGRTKEEVQQYELEENFKYNIIEYLTNRNYAQWENRYDNKLSRTEQFINTFPMTNYSDVKIKIDNYKVIVIGLGTAGSYVLEILTKIGFNNITIVDGDKISEENLEAQFYVKENIGEYKVDVIKKYYPEVSITTIKNYITDYKIFKEKLIKEKFDFIINCADDIELTKNLLLDKKNKLFSSILIESGYSPLIHQTCKIETSKEAGEVLANLENTKIFSKDNRILAGNNGSIFNAWISAFSIGKILFDYAMEFDVSEYGEFDFMQNRYYLGSKYNKISFDLYSRTLQKNMKYSSFQLDNELKITEDNIFTIDTKNSIKENDITNENIIEFVKTKYKIEAFKKYEDAMKEVFKNIRVVDELNTEEIDDNFIGFIRDKYDVDYKQIKNILDNYIIEKKYKNTISQQNIQRIGEGYTIFNQSYENEYERIMGRIHEILHYIYYNITNNEDTFEHEEFVIKNEIMFYKMLEKKKDIYYNLSKYYFYSLLYKHIINYISLYYEKCRIKGGFNNFITDYENLIKTNKTALIEILNSSIKKEIPFYKLKYFRAFEKNKIEIEIKIKEIINGGKR